MTKKATPVLALTRGHAAALTTLRGGQADFGDSPQAVRAVELFLKVATPAATETIDNFLAHRRTFTAAAQSLDEFLLANLRRPVKPGEDPGPFVTEWQAFASGATAKNRSDVAKQAWNQWRAFGGESDRALPMLAGDAETDDFVGVGEAAGRVTKVGVARIDGCLSATTASDLRSYILAHRDASVAAAAADSEKGAQHLSRVLSPRDAGSEAVTRWDVRLPWDAIIRDAVTEMMGDGPRSLGHALSALSGGDEAELFECAAIISAVGAAPQIVHSDTVFEAGRSHLGPLLHTAFVALQDVTLLQGPTRFLLSTHTCTESHAQLGSGDGTAFCAGAASSSALLGSGDCTLYDSRLLHCGGPHRGGPERVLFYVSIRHVSAMEKELSNDDVHGAGSILPTVAARQMRLAELRPAAAI